MSSSKISKVIARRVWDSRGNPTVETDVYLENGAMGRAIAPAGASRGTREAVDLRDGGDRLGGMDVQGAVTNVNEKLAPALIGRDVLDQKGIDAQLIEIDGTKLKSAIGGNAMIATSLATLHAAAAYNEKPLWAHVASAYNRKPTMPLPEIQIFGGGAHAGRRVDVQDFMVMVPGATSFDEAMEVTSNVYRAAGKIMAKRGHMAGVADEGGWWPVFSSNEEALETLTQAIEDAGEVPGERVIISLDIAASEFGNKDGYKLALEDRAIDTDGMIEILGKWIEKYPIASIEDPLAEDDVAGNQAFTKAFGDKVQIIGDDYLVTNAELVRQAAKDKACNAVLVKVNQAGTVSEAVETFEVANKVGYRSIVSARSGETEDVSITHLSIGLGAGQLKVGSFTRSERMAKWNECIRLQEETEIGAFVGGEPLKNTWWKKK